MAALALGLKQERDKGEQISEMLQPAVEMGKVTGKGENFDAAGCGVPGLTDTWRSIGYAADAGAFSAS